MSRAVAVLALSIAAVLLFSGCVSLTPAQERQLDDWRGFAKRVTQHYGKPDVQIMVGTTNAYGDGVSGMRSDGLMILSPALLEPAAPGRSRDFGFAHELGHWVTSQDGCPSPACETAANAEAVKILVIGRPGVWTEPAAFRHAVGYLCGIKARQEAGRPVTQNHLPAAQEIADLVKRYPDYRAVPC